MLQSSLAVKIQEQHFYNYWLENPMIFFVWFTVVPTENISLRHPICLFDQCF